MDHALNGVPKILAAKDMRAARRDVITPRLDRTLENADQLLSYAAEAGIEIEPDVAQRIIAARHGGNAVWDGAGAGDLMTAITLLAAKTHPVTAATLRASRDNAHPQIRIYTLVALVLALLLIPLSMISFISTGISKSIADDVHAANDLAVVLHAQLESAPGESVKVGAPQPDTAPPESLANLQQFASLMRSIRDHTEKLNYLVPHSSTANVLDGPSPLASMKFTDFQLRPTLQNQTAALRSETNRLTDNYQKLRWYAKEVQDDVSLFYGCIGACVLPMLYALLGACAYLLRLFSDELNTRTFSPSYAISARFFIALIGGMIVGLFNNFTLMQGVALPPLAVAFLVGYGADVFFSFLEGLLANFKRAKST